VSCVLLRSGLGSPTDIAVVREATGLLKFLIVLLVTDFSQVFIFLALEMLVGLQMGLTKVWSFQAM